MLDDSAKSVDHVIKGFENHVAETRFAQMRPNLVNGIHLGCGRREIDYSYVFGNFKTVCAMPRRAIANQYNMIIRIFLTQVLEKNIHANCITMREDSEKAVTRQGFYRAENIPILANVVTGHGRTDTSFAPAALGFVDPPKPRFVFKHQPNLTVRTFVQFVVDHSVNFFEASTASSDALFGCLLRGITFRQPWRFSIL